MIRVEGKGNMTEPLQSLLGQLIATRSGAMQGSRAWALAWVEGEEPSWGLGQSPTFIRRRGVTFRQHDSEFCPVMIAADQVNRSAVRFHDLTTNIQPETETTVMAIGNGPFEAAENALLLIRRNADTLILDAQECLICR